MEEELESILSSSRLNFWISLLGTPDFDWDVFERVYSLDVQSLLDRTDRNQASPALPSNQFTYRCIRDLKASWDLGDWHGTLESGRLGPVTVAAAVRAVWNENLKILPRQQHMSILLSFASIMFVEDFT
jgi:hypothetical protein